MTRPKSGTCPRCKRPLPRTGGRPKVITPELLDRVRWLTAHDTPTVGLMAIRLRVSRRTVSTCLRLIREQDERTATDGPQSQGTPAGSTTGL